MLRRWPSPPQRTLLKLWPPTLSTTFTLRNALSGTLTPQRSIRTGSLRKIVEQSLNCRLEAGRRKKQSAHLCFHDLCRGCGSEAVASELGCGNACGGGCVWGALRWRKSASSQSHTCGKTSRSWESSSSVVETSPLGGLLTHERC